MHLQIHLQCFSEHFLDIRDSQSALSLSLATSRQRTRSTAMPSSEKLDTHHKALTLNLDPSTFGSFAEIGAGQEVARWFLVVGGASGTVAKTISAYDKEVSDDLYGSGSRYVSRQRLEAMLDHEWSQLLTQLSKTRGSQTRFRSWLQSWSSMASSRCRDT